MKYRRKYRSRRPRRRRYKSKRRIPKCIAPGYAPLTLRQTNVYTQTSAQGVQAVYTPVSTMHYTDVNSMQAVLQALVEKQAGSGLTTILPSKFFIHSTDIDIKMVNQYNVPCDITLYVCIPKRGLPINNFPDQNWQAGYSGIAFGTEPQINAGLTNQVTSSAVNYNARPFDSHPFGNNWTVVKSWRHLQVQSGRQVIHKWRKNINKVFDMTMNEFEWTTHSVAFLVVVNGCLDRQAQITGQAGISNAEVDMVFNTRHVFSPVAVTSRGQATTDTLITGVLTSETAAKPYLGVGVVPYPVQAASATTTDNAAFNLVATKPY